MQVDTSAPLVDIAGLNVTFRTPRGDVLAIRGLDLSLGHARTLAILGESGSGKSVTLRALLGLLPARRTEVTGTIRVAGHDVLALSGRALERYRGKVASMIFQDPGSALDPLYKVGAQIAEAIVQHDDVSWSTALRRSVDLLNLVRVPSAAMRVNAYPHELSGGLRQRVMIALALACKPVLLLADEPTTALDPTVQIQIIHLLRELQREFRMTVIFVTHDVGVAVEIADEIAVMYAGRIVERASAADFTMYPSHPYSVALLAARTSEAAKGARLGAIIGSPPIISQPIAGCSFAPRCVRVQAICGTAVPPRLDMEEGHSAECFFATDRTPAHPDVGA